MLAKFIGSILMLVSLLTVLSVWVNRARGKK
jgi:hypothetical protein